MDAELEAARTDRYGPMLRARLTMAQTGHQFEPGAERQDHNSHGPTRGTHYTYPRHVFEFVEKDRPPTVARGPSVLCYPICEPRRHRSTPATGYGPIQSFASSLTRAAMAPQYTEPPL